MDGNLFFYDLAVVRETNNRVADREFTEQQNKVVFTSLSCIPGQLYSAIVVGE